MPGAIKLASNEVPYGPLPGVVEAVTEAIAGAHRYPDMGVVALRAALADRLGVDPDRIATGCGSVALAEHLVRATCLPGDEIVYSWRSFEAYPIIAATSGATSVRVPNTAEHGHDLPAMAAAITDRTRLVLVCNPNNPTGTAIRKAELDAFLDAVPADVLVVLDEAYREFVTDPDVPDGLVTYGDRPNVVVLRTLSKAWGLAGLRVGYLVGPARGGRRRPQGGHPVLHLRVGPGRGARRAAGRPTRCSAGVRPGDRRARAGHRGGAQAVPGRARPARPTSSGCRWATGRSTFAAGVRGARRDRARRSPATASASRSAPRTRTTPSWPPRRPR